MIRREAGSRMPSPSRNSPRSSGVNSAISFSACAQITSVSGPSPCAAARVASDDSPSSETFSTLSIGLSLRNCISLSSALSSVENSTAEARWPLLQRLP